MGGTNTNTAPPALLQLAEGLWVGQRPLTVLGVDIGTKMTVVRLANGGLFVHSPVPLGWKTREELDALGPVQVLVAPNRFHHLYLKEYIAAYPDAAVYAAPGLEAKRRDLHFTGILRDRPEPAWDGQLDQLLFRGVPLLNEVIFFHPASRTLILTDLAFNMHGSRIFTRWALRLDDAYGRFGVGRVEKWLVRDRAAARQGIDRMVEWDFDRIVVAHGHLVESGGKEMLRAAFSWL